MAFGVVIFVVAVFVLIRWGIRRDEQSAAPIGIALIVFGLLFDALMTQGRFWLKFDAASQSRYTTNDVLVLAGIYLTVLSGTRLFARDSREVRNSGTGWRFKQPFVWIRGHVERIDGRVIRRFALAAIAIQVVVSVPLGIKDAREFHQLYLTTAFVTANIKHEPDSVVIRELYFVQSGSWIRAQAQYAREHHLSQFG
jgi:hypothetical protein